MLTARLWVAWPLVWRASSLAKTARSTRHSSTTGDHVIVVNAAKIRISGLKADSKVYHHYSGYPGGMKSEEYKKRLVRKPEQIVEEAITGMLPHTKLGRAMAGKLKVYRDDKHPHIAQKPETLAAAKRA